MKWKSLRAQRDDMSNWQKRRLLLSLVTSQTRALLSWPLPLASHLGPVWSKAIQHLHEGWLAGRGGSVESVKGNHASLSQGRKGPHQAGSPLFTAAPALSTGISQHPGKRWLRRSQCAPYPSPDCILHLAWGPHPNPEWALLLPLILNF